jgi:hypothetical protein
MSPTAAVTVAGEKVSPLCPTCTVKVVAIAPVARARRERVLTMVNEVLYNE